jgi:hypothetical protein
MLLVTVFLCIPAKVQWKILTMYGKELFSYDCCMRLKVRNAGTATYITHIISPQLERLANTKKYTGTFYFILCKKYLLTNSTLKHVTWGLCTLIQVNTGGGGGTAAADNNNNNLIVRNNQVNWYRTQQPWLGLQEDY